MEGGCFQFNPKNIFFIFYIKVLASVLHLGNIHFNALDKEGTEVIIVIVMIAILSLNDNHCHAHDNDHHCHDLFDLHHSLQVSEKATLKTLAKLLEVPASEVLQKQTMMTMRSKVL